MESRQCFVICPIGDDHSPVRRNSDLVIRFLIDPVARKMGFTTIRADQIHEPGVITAHVLDLLQRADLVVADLTDHNPNVFYELALRHGTNRPCVHLIQKGQRIPFDVSSMRAIVYNLADPEELELAREQLDKQIATALSTNNNNLNPIRGMFEMQQLVASNEPTHQVLGRILSSVEELGRRVGTAQHGPQDALTKRMFEDLWNYFSVRVRDGAPAQSREVYLQMSRLDTDVRVADAALSDGNPGLADALYDRVLKQEPEHKLALIGKAKTLRRLWAQSKENKKLMDAINLLKECLRYHPAYERALYNIACYKTLWNTHYTSGAETTEGPQFSVEEIVNDLRQAIELFEHYRLLGSTDTDFDFIRSRPEVQELFRDSARQAEKSGKGLHSTA